MYRAYNLSLEETDFLELNKNEPVANVFNNQAKENSLVFKSMINTFETSNNELGVDIDKLLDGETIDGNQLINEWFPEIKGDIFLSHSHQDEDLAIKFAAWIKKHFNLNVFIDSTVWKYSDDLLEMIDNKYCYQPITKTYNYKKRNLSTSHIHLMLSTALTNMIDNCECLIFLNTPSSISIENSLLEGENSGKTHSPWIYNELFISSIIRRKQEREKTLKHDGTTFSAEERAEKKLDISYQANLTHLLELNKDELFAWIENNKINRYEHPLDNLYSFTEKTLV